MELSVIEMTFCLGQHLVLVLRGPDVEVRIRIEDGRPLYMDQDAPAPAAPVAEPPPALESVAATLGGAPDIAPAPAGS